MNIMRTLSAVALTFVVALAFAGPTRVITGGTTQVKLSDEFLGALGALGLSANIIEPGRIFGAAGSAFIAFPIPSGDLDLGTAKGEINHLGGLTLSTQTTTVRLRNFVIDTTGAKPVLTGLVVVNGDVVARLPLFDLQLPRDLRLPLPDVKILSLRGVGVTLNATAAGALNSVFGVNAFVEGFPIGIATSAFTLGR